MTKAVVAYIAFVFEIFFGSLAAFAVFNASASFVHAHGRKDDLIVFSHPIESLLRLVGLQPFTPFRGVVASFLPRCCHCGHARTYGH